MEKLKVLLVDDELDLLEIIRSRIATWGYDLIEASSGKAAVEAVERQKPDMVVLDYRMPDMDGVATLKKIRQINSKIPVIMFTAYPDMKTIEGTERLGVSVFIPKLSPYESTSNQLKTALDMIRKKHTKQA
jgi:two-component system response regulator HydG